MKKILAAAALALLTACASQPVDLATAPHVPAKRVLDKTFLEDGPGKAPVRFSYEPGTIRPDMVIVVDSKDAVVISKGEQAEIYVLEGFRVFTFRANHSLTGRSPTTRDYVTREGQQLAYALSFDGDGYKLVHDTR